MTAATEVALLREVDGIGPALARGLSERFPTWNDLANASEESLESMRGMRKSALQSVRALARGRVLEGELADFETAIDDDIASRPLAEPKTADHEDGSYVLQALPIDPNTVLRRYVPQTPCVCPDCGWDAVERFAMKPYEQLPPGEQSKMRDALAEHRRIKHSQRQVLTEAEFRASRKGQRYGVIEA